MKQLIGRLEEASGIGSWKKFFEDLDLDDVELHSEADGNDKRGDAVFRGDIDIYDGAFVYFTVSWAVKGQRMSVSLDWEIHERDFHLDGDSNNTFPIKPGVHKKVEDWLNYKVEMGFEEIAEELSKS